MGPRLYYQDYASVGQQQVLGKEIVPANYVHGPTSTPGMWSRHPIPYQQIGTDARVIGQHEKPTLMFLVVGRRPSQNHSLNGYEKGDQRLHREGGQCRLVQERAPAAPPRRSPCPCMFSGTRPGVAKDEA